jgi:DNA-binding FadR family transcriptional regulator
MRAEKAKMLQPSKAVVVGNGNARTQQPRVALSDFIYHKLFAKIAAGDYVQNQRLPSENELAQSFGVSRPIVRAALDRLRGDGLVYSRQGSGSYIRAETGEAVVSFGAIATIADIQRCYEFRIALETEAAFCAATRADEATIAEMNAAMGPLRNGAARYRYEDEADFAFHCAIAKGANNHYFLRTLMALKDHIAVGMKIGGTCLVGSTRQIDRVIDEHVEIIRFITDRDADGAGQAMRRHIVQARARVFEGKLLDLSL